VEHVGGRGRIMDLARRVARFWYGFGALIGYSGAKDETESTSSRYVEDRHVWQ
jgi:hypothetical protein